MAKLLAVVAAFLEGQGWAHEQLPGGVVMSFPFQGDEERWVCYAQAQEEHQRVTFYSVCPFNIPAEQRLAAAEFITRVNYGLIVGNFELDLDDGELRFKTSLDVKGATLTQALVERAVVPNLHAMNTYLPGLAAIVGGNFGTPAALVARIER